MYKLEIVLPRVATAVRLANDLVDSCRTILDSNGEIIVVINGKQNVVSTAYFAKFLYEKLIAFPSVKYVITDGGAPVLIETVESIENRAVPEFTAEQINEVSDIILRNVTLEMEVVTNEVYYSFLNPDTLALALLQSGYVIKQQ
jgi:hypothetical protein